MKTTLSIVVSKVLILNKSVYSAFLFVFFFNIGMTLTYKNYKPSNLYSSFYTKENVTRHPVPQSTKGRRISLCAPLPVSTVAELMPGCSQIITLPQSCSLLPGSQEKPFLKARKKHIRKFRFGVFIEKPE